MRFTEKDFVKSRKIFEKELQEDPGTNGGLRNSERKASHAKHADLNIIGQMAREKLSASTGSGKQPTFLLFDEWIKKSRKLSKSRRRRTGMNIHPATDRQQ